MIVLSDFREPDSVIRLQLANIKAVLDHRELGFGTLYITESLLSWQGPQGFSIEYPHISLHAISKDKNLYPVDCLYIMIDKHVQLPGVEPHEQNDDDSDNESDNELSELMLVPDTADALQAMYEAIRGCQELHPDPADDSADEDEAFEEMMEDAYEDLDGGGEGTAGVQNIQNLSIQDRPHNGLGGAGDQRQDMDDQFQDAD